MDRKYIVIAISVLMVITFLMRCLNIGVIFPSGGDYVLGGEPDISYNLRQLEQMLHSGKYAWYDPMTFFPTGDTIYWGILFTFTLYVLCFAVGVTTRPEIVYVASFLPPILAALMVPVMYFIGKYIGGTKTGITSAVMITFVSGQYFYRSMLGNVDHHIMETFLGAVFCMFYIAAITYSRKHITKDSYKKPDTRFFTAVALIIAATLSYLLGYLCMPTMIMFGMIVAIFIIIQFIIDAFTRTDRFYLVFVNFPMFMLLGIITYFTIVHRDLGTSLALYTIGHPMAYFAVAIITLAMYLLSIIPKNGSAWIDIRNLLLFFVFVLVTMFIALPDIFGFLVQAIYFFGQSAESNTVMEARPLLLENAFRSYNLGIISTIFGILVMLYYVLKERKPIETFILIWSIIVLFSTMQHVRYEYYASVVVALLTAVSVGFALEVGGNDLFTLFRKKMEELESIEDEKQKISSQHTQQSDRKKKLPKRERYRREVVKTDKSVNIIVCLTLLIPSILFVPLSANTNITIGTTYSYSLMENDWRVALEWMQNNTPDTGVDYYAVYDQKEFVYPDTAYGVMSWWDYGHWITFFAKRIPNANPFQHGVAGEYSASSYFMQENEEDANKILDMLGTRYVITDIEMAYGKFWAMATWYNSSLKGNPYIPSVYIQKDPISGERFIQNIFTDKFYRSMVSRLHYFDGNKVTSSPIVAEIKMEGNTPVVVGGRRFDNMQTAKTFIEAFNRNTSGKFAITLGVKPYESNTDLEALRHYRLIYESPTNAAGEGDIVVKYVKIFEYVKGSHIRGDGTISINITTNTGRTFTYRQDSIDGEFVVPYAGRYVIEGSETIYEVTEEDVINGVTK